VETSPPSPPDPRIGNVLQGRYRILDRIASGAMGVVYKGERVQLGRPVAVKFLHPWIAAQKAFLSRFENEAKAMSRLAHPNCVSVIDFGVEGSPYLVMDFVTGRTLREVMEQDRLTVERALGLVRQLLAGLAHAHAQGIVHRDLKPENVVLGEEEGLGDHLRILDFGLAKLRDGPAMTAGLAVGTPSYMSPEQTGGEGTVDSRADLYAVGIMLFELLAGQKPFLSEKIGDLILMHREAPPPRLREVVPGAGFSAEMEDVLQKAMAKMPDGRFQSAGALAAAIEATPEGRGGARPSSARPAPAPAPTPALPPPTRSAPTSDATIIDSASAVRRYQAEIAGGAAAAPTEAMPKATAPAKAAAPAKTAAPAKAAAPAKTVAPAKSIKLGPLPALPARKLAWLGVGVLAAVVVAVIVVRSSGGGGAPAGAASAAAVPAPAAGSASTAAPGAPTAPARPDDPRIDEARKLVAAGSWEQAVALLNHARVDNPDNAEAAYMLASVYLDNKRWSDGIAAAQVAVRKNPAFKSDPDLIKAAIASLAADRSYEKAQAFLRSLGAPATPFIREAARHDPNPRVRERAEELLQGGGRSAWGATSHSSGGGVFHR
jgi:serine/threonine-protein kinase